MLSGGMQELLSAETDTGFCDTLRLPTQLHIRRPYESGQS